jgi:hypothetical protein
VAISTAQPVRFPDAFLEVRSKIFPTAQAKLSGLAQTWRPHAMFSTKNQFKIPRTALNEEPLKGHCTDRAQQAHHLIKGL